METYKNITLPMEDRVRDLLSRMTIEEKASQMLHDSPAVERLGIPKYCWWNEGLHGVARAGVATVFPQAIGLAATWNTSAMHSVATAISDEARAKHHAAVRNGIRDTYFGLTYWSPNINIFRDPRWGRGHETYGEDPYLTGRMGVAFVKGLQGRDPCYLKVIATPKHYAVHSGPELDRHGFDAVVSGQDLRETYLAAFKACVKEGKAAAIMGAYNRTNGEPCCGSPTLLQKILRDEWGFGGHVVSDCGAVCDFHNHHKVTRNAAESSAMAVKNGCDLNCGETFRALLPAVKQGLLTEADLDRALTRLFLARFRLGMFDPPKRVPYARIPTSVNDCPAHRKLALKVARESIVLLKNDKGILPLRKNLKSIAVVGPNAGDLDVLLGNYNGLNSRLVTVVEGICSKVSPETSVNWQAGCRLAGQSTAGFGAGLYCAQTADLIIAVMGLSANIEGEEGAAMDSDSGGDRQHLGLPGVQEEFLKKLHELGKPIVLVLMSGSAVAVNWAQEHVAAIVETWYPGEEGGTAVADVLFGDYNPAGRLPVTFYKGIHQLPDFRDYRMVNRTYRYFRGEPLYPFGYGLSYTTFRYRDLKMKSVAEGVEVHAQLQNTGKRAGDEVVQVYVSDRDAGHPVAIRALKAFRRVHLKAGEKKRIEFVLGPDAFLRTYPDGREAVEAGIFEISVGGGQPLASVESTSGAVLTATCRFKPSA